jgi:hypothetical protein
LLKIGAKTEQVSQPRLRKLGFDDAVLKQFAGKIEGKWPRPVASI